MKLKFGVVLLFVFSTMFSQSVSGIVVDQNDEPLMGATVYFDGSSYGTTTSIDGKFSITIPSKISSSLIISFVGFEKAYINNLNFDRKYKIILKEITENLKEVIVSNNRFSRKQMLIVFRNQFLGTTKAGNQCKIENEDEIYFSYDNKKFVLYAYADKPLVIDNPYLGYKIYYDLNLFDAKFSFYSINSQNIFSSIYAGSSRFVETNFSKKILKNREKTFQNSYLQLFRIIANNTWSKDKFSLYNGSFQDNPNSHFTLKDTLGLKQISVKRQAKNLKPKNFVAEFNLLFDKKEQSKISFFTDIFYIDKFGLFTNYDEIYFSGALSEKKVGDLLPSDYGIE